ncbi:MAG: 4-phosphoerythronate dehydrogenase [Candidatus Egerieousia sp.]
MISLPRIIIDDAIPYIKGVFEPYAKVFYCKGSEFGTLYASNASDDNCKERIIDTADALIIRTRTKCDASLLEGTGVKFIATATIGTDHIDLEYCKSKNIRAVSAPGCNSGAVMQYVFAALYALMMKKNCGKFGLYRRVLGVVGVGHVGSKVAALGEALGLEVLRNDPLKEIEQKRLVAEGKLSEDDAVKYCALDELLDRADIVTLHVPLTNDGEYATRSMADQDFFRKMKKGSVFINSCRGQVVDDKALIGADNLSGIILDVWNGEPDINLELLKKVDIATPHIAGYSVEGKINGTETVVRACAEYLDIKELKSFSLENLKSFQRLMVSGKPEERIAEEILKGFPILELDAQLRHSTYDFERIRSEYMLRNEFKWE